VPVATDRSQSIADPSPFAPRPQTAKDLPPRFRQSGNRLLPQLRPLFVVAATGASVVVVVIAALPKPNRPSKSKHPAVLGTLPANTRK